MDVIWSPLALEKVRDIAEYIALDNDIAATKWVNDIFDKAENIFGNYCIIYSVLSEVNILTVRNCRQLLSFDDI